MKGADPLIIAILMIIITVTTASIISGWATSLFQSQGQELKNQTTTKLACQMASFYVRNVSVACNYNCFTGSPYSLNASVENTGSQSVSLSNIIITLSNGISHVLYGTPSSLSAGSTTNEAFNAIQIWASPRMPVGTMDTRAAYFNDTNTTMLYHFDYSSGTNATDNSSSITGTLFNGSTVCQGAAAQCPAWNSSGKFGSAITFDSAGDYVQLASSSFSNNTGTVEAWINMNKNIASNNYTIFATPSQISNTDAGLVLLTHFSENSTGSSGVKDSSPYGNSGTATNSPTFTNSGRFGTGWDLNGVNQYIDFGNPARLKINGTLTIMGWVYLKQDKWSFWISKSYYAQGRLAVGYYAASKKWFLAPGTTSLLWGDTSALNRWVHIAVTYDKSLASANWKTYQDGIPRETLTYTAGDAMWNDVNLFVGGQSGDSAYFWNGTIDEVAIYNRTLSPEEIRDRYLGGLSLHKTGTTMRFTAGNTSAGYDVSSWTTGWHNVAGTYNDSTASLYLDSHLVNSSSNRGMVVFGSNSFIGGVNATVNKTLAFNGTIDEVRVSSFNRSFNVTLNINVTYPNIMFVRLFNATGLVNQSTNQNGASSYYTRYENAKANTEFRVEVEDTSGKVITKWYPYDTGGMCMPVSSIDRVRFATDNCPGVTDSYYGSDVYYEQCL